MLASTVSSKFLASMAKQHGFIFRDTLTGFKWMGNTAIDMVLQGYIFFLFAYEVEIGFLIGDSSFDKDGIRTGASFYEMASQYYKQGQSCIEKLNELRAKYGYFEMENSYRFIETPKLLLVFERLRSGFQHTYPKSMGKYKITRIRDVTTGYDSGEKNLKSILPLQPNQQMITFWFENGATATLRNSGTEPKLKYYVETMDEKDAKKAKELLKDMSSTLLKEFMEME